MKRGVAKLWICGAVMTAFLCLAIVPMTAQAQPTQTYPPGGITDPTAIEGVYRLKIKEKCFKWTDGKRWRVLSKEPLWMVLVHENDLENGVKPAQNGYDCPYRAIFFLRTGKKNKTLEDDLAKEPVGQGQLCFEFPQAFGEDLETWVVDGWMCKQPGFQEDFQCYMEFMGWFKGGKKAIPPKKLKGSGLMWCALFEEFMTAQLERIPAPADYLKCDMRWWAKRVGDLPAEREIELPCDQWGWESPQ